MSKEWHDYSEDNISYCQVCKDLYNDFKDEDAQLEDYHKIIPLSSKGKKKGIAATLEDFAKGAKLRLNKEYKGNSQLGAFDVVSDSDDEDKKTTTSSPKVTSTPKLTKKNKKGKTATLEDFANGAKLSLNNDYKGNSQLGAFDVISDSDEGNKKTTTSSPKATSSPKTQKNTVSKGGRRRRTHSKKRRSHTKKRRSSKHTYKK
jgi:hypothetical protein